MKYFPILKSKRGEFTALKELDGASKSLIVPIIEVLSDTEDAALTHLTSFWNFEDNSVIIDASLFFDSNHDVDDFLALINNLITEGVNPIPSVEFNSEPDYIDALKSYVEKEQLDICIRIRGSIRPRTLVSKIETLLDRLDIEAERAILLIDFESISSLNIESTMDKALDCLEALDNLSIYKKVVLAAGSFPQNLGFITADTRRELPRHENDLWNAVTKVHEGDNIAYGDYGIKFPVFDSSISAYEGTCSIKYTTDSHYLIYRGIRASLHPLGGGQYHEKCQLLLADPLYDGAGFSWGDYQINECALMNTGPGNSETWVRIGHNHHFKKILSLL